jgi:hypothetical protein
MHGSTSLTSKNQILTYRTIGNSVSVTAWGHGREGAQEEIRTEDMGKCSEW